MSKAELFVAASLSFVASVGCAQILGFESVSGLADAGPPDAMAPAQVVAISK